MPPAHEKIPAPEIAEPPALAKTPVPTDIVERCATGECVLLAGSGLSARSGLSTWGESITRLLEWAVETRVIDPSRAQTQRAALSEDRNVVADNLVSAFQKNRDLLIEFAKRNSLTDTAPSPAHHLLRQIPFAAVLTSNLDDLLERAYIPQEAEALLEALSARKPFLLKLYGTLEKPPTVIFSPAEYKALISSHVPFPRFMEGLFFSRTLLFVGCSLDGITDFLNSFPFRAENPRRHYALVGVFGTAWQAKAEALERRYNVEVIPFDISEGYGAVDVFLQELAARTEEERSKRSQAPPAVESRLRRVILRNIGPFEELELDLQEPWLVLLGDNGVGKSSILKALAVAMVGSEASAVAGRLVREGQSLATITLITDKNPIGYVTDIYKSTGEARVISKPSRPLESEGGLRWDSHRCAA